MWYRYATARISNVIYIRYCTYIKCDIDTLLHVSQMWYSYATTSISGVIELRYCTYIRCDIDTLLHVYQMWYRYATARKQLFEPRLYLLEYLHTFSKPNFGWQLPIWTTKHQTLHKFIQHSINTTPNVILLLRPRRNKKYIIIYFPKKDNPFPKVYYPGFIN